MSEHIFETYRDQGGSLAVYITEAIGITGVTSYRKEVVRCRDCVNFKLDQSDHECREPFWCNRWHRGSIDPAGFCAWAERKGEAR